MRGLNIYVSASKRTKEADKDSFAYSIGNMLNEVHSISRYEAKVYGYYDIHKYINPRVDLMLVLVHAESNGDMYIGKGVHQEVMKATELAIPIHYILDETPESSVPCEFVCHGTVDKKDWTYYQRVSWELSDEEDVKDMIREHHRTINGAWDLTKDTTAPFTKVEAERNSILLLHML